MIIKTVVGEGRGSIMDACAREASRVLLMGMDDNPETPWAADAMAKFRARMLDDSAPFPCIFGADAVRRNTLRVAAIAAGPERVEQLAEALRLYLPTCRELGTRTSLVTLFEPDQDLRAIEDYRAHFWSLMQGLHDLDEAGWPVGISTSVQSPTWEFSFHGTPMFVVANTPLHGRRRSRFFEYLAITFQPRFVFDDLGESSPQGIRSRRIIRRRLAAYDQAPAAANLGSFGAAGNHEWTQYFLDDTDTGADSAAACPFAMRHPEKETSI